MYACIRMFSKNKLSYSFFRLKHNLIKFVLRACWYKITIFLANTVRASKRTSLFFYLSILKTIYILYNLLFVQRANGWDTY